MPARKRQENDMAKKIRAVITLQIEAGKANPAPPVGPALGQHGINIMGFCKEYNEKTAVAGRHDRPGRDHGLRGPLVHVRAEDTAGQRPAQEGGGSREGLAAHRSARRWARYSARQLKKIAEMKMKDLNANDVEAAMKMVEGTARSMGIEVS